MHEERFTKVSTYNFNKTFKMFNEFVVVLLFMSQIMLPRSKIFLSCLSFSHSVNLSETLTLLITFQQ